MRRGSWSKEEDEILINYVKLHGHGKWRRIANNAGLKRSGKSCRLRWLNYLSPDIKRGDITVDEEDLIIRLHRLLGNRWSLIAGRLPGRTDNEIKNYWNTTLKKKSNMLDFSSRSNNKAMITKLSGEDTRKALASDIHDLVNNNNGDRLVSNLDSSLPVVDGMIFLPNENDAVFLADIGDIESGCFASDFNVASSLAQGCTSLEDDAKLHDVEFDKALNKLASFLDLDED